MISLCAAITAVGALIVIPLPIPITMQLFGVFLSGFVLGPLYGAIAQIVYILVGIAGLPVFAGGTGGISIFASPTLGYLLAFPIASAAIGIICKKKTNSTMTIFFAIAIAMGIIYALGICYLYIWSRYIAGKSMSIVTVISIGALPFLPFDAVKGYFAALVAKRIPKSLITAGTHIVQRENKKAG